MYLLVFLLSGIGRWVAAVVFVPRLKEERAVQHIPYHKLLFDVVNPMPTIGIVRNIIKNKGKKPDEDISEWD